MKNPYKQYKSPKYLALIEKLQGEGYKWMVGAFHQLYLVPPDSIMGYPSFIGGNMTFVDATKYPQEMADVYEELYS